MPEGKTKLVHWFTAERQPQPARRRHAAALDNQHFVPVTGDSHGNVSRARAVAYSRVGHGCHAWVIRHFSTSEVADTVLRQSARFHFGPVLVHDQCDRLTLRIGYKGSPRVRARHVESHFRLRDYLKLSQTGGAREYLPAPASNGYNGVGS